MACLKHLSKYVTPQVANLTGEKSLCAQQNIGCGDFGSHRFVAYLLKERTVEPEKQPLLANGSETTFVPRRRFAKHVPAATDTHETIELLLKSAFSNRSVQRGL
jgi:hypothetical protein